MDAGKKASAELQQKTESKEKVVVVDETEKFKELQMAYMTVSLEGERPLQTPLTCWQYGNEPGIGINYTRAAMLIRIPPFLQRPEKTLPKSFWSGIKRSGDAGTETSRRGYNYSSPSSEYDSDDEERELRTDEEMDCQEEGGESKERAGQQ